MMTDTAETGSAGHGAATGAAEVNPRALSLELVRVKSMLAALAAREEFLRNLALRWMQHTGAERLRAFDDDGADLGTVVLAGGGPKAEIDDAAKLLEWVREHHPDEVVVTTSVRGSFMKRLLDDFTKVGGGDVPGLRLVDAAPYIATTPSSVAKARATEAFDAPPAR